MSDASSMLPNRDQNHFLSGGGELGQLIRASDWRSTSLGDPEAWPRNLKLALRIMLNSRQPMWIGWGPSLVYFYNDAYRSIIGGKHPWALGRPTSEVWHELWDDIGEMLELAMSGRESTYVEAQPLIMERNGYPEETYYTFSYSPIPNDDGSVGGIICANTDDTQRVMSERQLALLRELAAGATNARTWQEVSECSMRALRTDARDLPFALLYLAEPDKAQMKLAGSSGIEAGHELGHGRQVGHVRETLRSRHAEHTDAARIHLRQHRWNRRQHALDLAGHHVGQRLSRALVGHVRHLGARLKSQQLHREVVGARRPG